MDVHQYGGIIGKTWINNYIQGCYNSGKASADDDVGGIIGSMPGDAKYPSKVSNCYNTGVVSSNRIVGGIIGNMYFGDNDIVEYCYNIGTIEGKGATYFRGSIIGHKNNGIVQNCYYIGTSSIKAVENEDDEENNVCSLSEEYMKSVDFVNLLNNNGENVIWKSGENFYKYPMLNWQTDMKVGLNSIKVTIEPSKTTYIAGENFDKTGMVITATYGDGSTEEITDYTVVNGTNLKCGEQKITIQYNGNTEIKTEITVSVEHAEVIDQAVAATCETEGKTEGKHCSVCSKVLVAQETVPALGHNYENGVCTRCGEKEPKVEVISEKYEVGEKYITKINSKTTAKNLKENLQTNTNNITIYNKDNEEVEENGIIGTGSKIELQLGNETITLILVITGDTSGDGNATFTDILQINKHRLNKSKLEEEYLKAGDVTGDGKVDFSDILQINKYRLGKISSL